MAIKICEKCGTENPENTIYCNSCGASLSNTKITGVSENQKFIKPRPERCPNCDKVIANRPVLCPLCGYDLTSNEGDRFDFSLEEKTSKPNNIGIYILSFLIPLVGIIIGAIWLASDDKKENGGKAIFFSILGIVVGLVLTLNTFFI